MRFDFMRMSLFSLTHDKIVKRFRDVQVQFVCANMIRLKWKLMNLMETIGYFNNLSKKNI